MRVTTAISKGYMLSVTHEKALLILRFSVFPIFSYWWASVDTIFLCILDQWTVLVLLNLQLRLQLRIAGESASKRLLRA